MEEEQYLLQEEKDLRGENGAVQCWQERCLKMENIPIVGEGDLRTFSPEFNTARWDDVTWDMLEEVDKRFVN